MKHGKPSRRQLLQMGAAVGGSLLAGREALALDTDPRQLGVPLGPYSERSPFEKAVRWRRESKTPETGSSFTPLHDSVGMVTPSALHYERHHSGIPTMIPRDIAWSFTAWWIGRSPCRWPRSGGCRRSRASSRSSAAATAPVSGEPQPEPTSSGVMVSSAAASGPAFRCRCCSPRLACSHARHG